MSHVEKKQYEFDTPTPWGELPDVVDKFFCYASTIMTVTCMHGMKKRIKGKALNRVLVTMSLYEIQ